MEKCYVMIKPGFASKREVVKEIRNRVLACGLEIKDEKYVVYTKEASAIHYGEHVNASYYKNLEEYITSDCAYGMVVEGENAIAKIERIVGKKNNLVPGTIRYDIPQMLGVERRTTENVVHSSGNVKEAKIEIDVFNSLKESADAKDSCLDDENS